MDNEQKIRKTLEEAIHKVGVEEGDIVLVHSDITPIVHLGDLKEWKKQSKLLNQNFAKFLISRSSELLKQSFLSVLGEKGTLIVPTFNYDFCQGKPYFHETSESQVGVFSNFILNQKESVRSFHPIMSFAAIGPAADKLFTNLSKSTFGIGSVFQKLHQHNIKIMCFNVKFRECTFVHYIEQDQQVEYRYFKNFVGLVSKSDKQHEDSFDYYVRRYSHKEVDLDLTRLEKDLLSKKMNKIMLADKYPLLCTYADAFYKTAVEKLNLDPFYLLTCSPKGKCI